MQLSNFLPETFTAKKYVKVNGRAVYQTVEQKVDQKVIDNCERLIWLIRSAQYFANTHQLVNLDSTIILRVVGKYYKSIIDLLVHSKLITYNTKFSTRLHFSKSFSIHKEASWIFNHFTKKLYNESDLMKVNESDNITTGCKTKSNSSKQRKQCNEDILISYSYVLQPVLSGVTKYIYNTLIHLHQNTFVVQPSLKVSSACGRIFTNVNRMSKADRSKIVDDQGNQFITVDFSTSHLQHLIKLIGDNSSAHAEELRRFKIAVLEGDFYSSTGLKYTRDKIKTYVMCWLASSRPNWKGVKQLKDLYPSITEFIEAYNNGTRNILLNELMRSESNLINHTILKAIADDERNITAYSIHDAIMIEPTHIELLVNHIITKGEQFLGFKPKFRIESNNQPVLITAIKPAEEIKQEPARVTVLVKPTFKPRTRIMKHNTNWVLQNLVDVHGRSSKIVIEYAAINKIQTIPQSRSYSDFPNAGKIKGKDALRVDVQSWPDIDEMLDKIGCAQI